MKITILLLVVGILHVSAGTFAQKVTVNEKNVHLEQVFKQIRVQSGYKILIDVDLLKSTKSVTLNVKNVTAEKAITEALKGQNLTFETKDKMLIITQKEKSLIDKIVDYFAKIDVTGKVVDENGQPIAGANIKVKGTNLGTTTNGEGIFILKNVEENAVLEISYLGFTPKEAKANKDLGILRMEMTVGKLEEVRINAGYYSVTDRERTGSISRITSKDIEKQPVNNVLAAMQANVPGLQITQNTGVPGGGFTVRVRGQNSISQGNDPLYIIDGVPFTSTGLAGSRSISITPNANPLASINPSDIESIEVLKDADATAIYGSRGANGVILITKKKGKSGKAQTSFSLNQGVSRVTKRMDLMNTSEYQAMRKEALLNDKLPISSTDYDINGVWSNKRNVDWQSELIGRNAPTTNALMSLSGGTGNITYLVGGAYYRESTVFPGKNSFVRNSGNFSLQYSSDNKKFNMSFDANYSYTNSNLFTTDLTQFILLAPNYPALLNANGALNWENNTMLENPIANTQRPYDAKTSNLISNAALSYLIIPDLRIKANIGYTVMDRKELSKFPLTTYSCQGKFT